MIPRNGQGNIIVPGDPSSVTTEDDGVTVEAAVWITMAWTQLLYVGQDLPAPQHRECNSS